MTVIRELLAEVYQLVAKIHNSLRDLRRSIGVKVGVDARYTQELNRVSTDLRNILEEVRRLRIENRQAIALNGAVVFGLGELLDGGRRDSVDLTVPDYLGTVQIEHNDLLALGRRGGEAYAKHRAACDQATPVPVQPQDHSAEQRFGE